MFHAQCRELSLSTGAFCHSHAYDRSGAAPGPYTIQHLGGKPLHRRMPIYYGNEPFVANGHMVQITSYWRASYALVHPK